MELAWVMGWVKPARGDRRGRILGSNKQDQLFDTFVMDSTAASSDVNSHHSPPLSPFPRLPSPSFAALILPPE